jgi:hypothetical protein
MPRSFGQGAASIRALLRSRGRFRSGSSSPSGLFSCQNQRVAGASQNAGRVVRIWALTKRPPRHFSDPRQALRRLPRAFARGFPPEVHPDGRVVVPDGPHQGRPATGCEPAGREPLPAPRSGRLMSRDPWSSGDGSIIAWVRKAGISAAVIPGGAVTPLHRPAADRVEGELQPEPNDGSFTTCATAWPSDHQWAPAFAGVTAEGTPCGRTRYAVMACIAGSSAAMITFPLQGDCLGPSGGLVLQQTQNSQGHSVNLIQSARNNFMLR